MRWLPATLLAFLAAVSAASPAPVVESIAGVYKMSHGIAMHDGSLPPDRRVPVEDVIEIVAQPHGEAYLRLRLTFDNGHICALHGIARTEGEALVYRPRGDAQGQCVLGVRKVGGRIVLHDKDGACRPDFCGMRGILEGASFALSGRHPIRYMGRLLASREYREALTERDEGK
jgi:hypothetical protein